MKRILSKVVLVSLMCTTLPAVAQPPARSPEVLSLPPGLAFADPVDPNPGSPRRKLVAGWASLGFAALNIAQIPICIHVNEYDEPRGERVCIGAAATLAGLGLALGLPLTIYGYRQAARRKAWMRRHGLAAIAPQPWIAPHRGGGLTMRLSFGDNR